MHDISPSLLYKKRMAESFPKCSKVPNGQQPIESTYLYPKAAASSSAPITSLDIFYRFVHTYVDIGGFKTVNCDKVLSRECYTAWLNTRKKVPLLPEESFRKTLISHLVSLVTVCKSVYNILYQDLH